MFVLWGQHVIVINYPYQYLQYIKEFEGIEFVDVYQMAYQTETSLNYRRRSIKNDKPNNLQAGRAANGSYPGDKHFHSESVVSVQLHHIVLFQIPHGICIPDRS